MNMTEMLKLDEKALQEKVAAMRKELFELRLSATSTHVKDNSQFKKLRAGIARALTCLSQKRGK